MRHTLILIPFLGLSLVAGCKQTTSSTLDEHPGPPTARTLNEPPPADTRGDEQRSAGRYDTGQVDVDPILLEKQPVSGRAATALERKLGDTFGDDWSIAETR